MCRIDQELTSHQTTVSVHQRRLDLSCIKMTDVRMNQVRVRRATHADCGGIKGIIRDHYGGNDRCLNLFHQDVSGGTTFPYVAEDRFEIVAYTCGQVIEDGEFMVMRYGRVAQTYRGKSVIGQLKAVLIQAALVKFPNLQYLTWTSASEAACKMTLERHPYMQLVLHTAAEIFQLHPNTLKDLCESDMFRKLEEKYPTDAITTVPKCEVLRLLTEEIRFLDYAPTRPIIGWRPSGWHRSTLTSELQTTDLFITRSAGPQVSRIAVFSFMTTKRTDKGLGVDLMVYCPGGGCSTELVVAHLLYGLREAATLYSHTHIVYSFCYPVHIEPAAVLNVLTGQLGVYSDVDRHSTANMLQYKLSDAAHYTTSRL